MLGDTPYDIEAAANTDVITVALRCGGWDDESLRGATAIYDNPRRPHRTPRRIAVRYMTAPANSDVSLRDNLRPSVIGSRLSSRARRSRRADDLHGVPRGGSPTLFAAFLARLMWRFGSTPHDAASRDQRGRGNQTGK